MRRSMLFAVLALLTALPTPSHAQSEWESQVRNRLAQVASLARDRGYAATGNEWVSQLSEGYGEDFVVNLAGGGSYVIVGVCDDDCTDIDLTLKDGSGVAVAVDEEDDAIPVLEVANVGGGRHTISVGMFGCSSEPCYFAVGVYRLEGSADDEEWAGGDAYVEQMRAGLDAVARGAADQGYGPTGDEWISYLDAGTSESQSVKLAAGRDYVVVGICDEDCADIDLVVYGPSGARVGSDVEDDDTPVVEIPDAPGGRYRIEMWMLECGAEPCYYALGVYVRGGGRESGPDAAAGAAAAPARTPERVEAGWDFTLTGYRDRPDARVEVVCRPGGPLGAVWGTGTYTDDSSVCTAAVHAGYITARRGGRVIVERRPGEPSYRGTARNGVTTADYGRWDWSFAFVDDGEAARRRSAASEAEDAAPRKEKPRRTAEPPAAPASPAPAAGMASAAGLEVDAEGYIPYRTYPACRDIKVLVNSAQNRQLGAVIRAYIGSIGVEAAPGTTPAAMVVPDPTTCTLPVPRYLQDRGASRVAATCEGGCGTFEVFGIRRERRGWEPVAEGNGRRFVLWEGEFAGPADAFLVRIADCGVPPSEPTGALTEIERRSRAFRGTGSDDPPVAGCSFGILGF